MSTYIKARSTTTNEWQRPNDWIAIPSIASGEQVFYGLVAVYDVIGGNRVAFTFAGNYTVDWGDGSALENVLSGVKAEHSYNYSTVSNPTSEGWRQALIKVIPTGAANITTVNLQQTSTGIAVGKTSQFMDIVMSVPNVTGASTNLVIGNGTTVFHRVVERIWIKEIGAINNMTAMFSGCSSLQSIPLFNTSSVTNMTTMFANCASLQNVPLFNTASVTNMDRMFSGCSSLESVPLFNTTNVNNAIGMQGMFTNCSSLQTVPLFDTSNVLGMGLMFFGCSSLQLVPLFNTASVTNMGQMFSGCSSLQSVPLFNTISVTSMPSMFLNCTSLQSVPAFNTTNVTTLNSMFQGCVSLNQAEIIATNVTNIATIFTAVNSLQRFIATGLTRGVVLSNNLMSATEINNFFTSLGTASGAQTITVTGNPGAATCDVTIATSKGFTVTI
jgi:surface protein